MKDSITRIPLPSIVLTFSGSLKGWKTLRKNPGLGMQDKLLGIIRPLATSAVLPYGVITVYSWGGTVICICWLPNYTSSLARCQKVWSIRGHINAVVLSGSKLHFYASVVLHISEIITTEGHFYNLYNFRLSYFFSLIRGIFHIFAEISFMLKFHNIHCDDILQIKHFKIEKTLVAIINN